MSLHLLPGQILPSSILRSYQCQTAAQYSHTQQPEFDPYAQYANIDPAPRPQRNVAPHRAHLPPRHRDRQSAAPHNHHRNMGPRMSQAQPVIPQHIPPVQPHLAMPTPQRPHSQYFEHHQHTSPPQLTVISPPIPQMTISPENDAFGHLPAGVLRMNTPTPPPVEPQRNPLLTPIQSSFDLQVQNGLIRRQSLPARAPQRAVPERPNPVDTFFRDTAPLPSVASAPTIAPFYQQNSDTSSLSSSSSSHHTQAPPPSYSSHSHTTTLSSGFNGSSGLSSSAHASDRKTPLSRSGSSGSDLDQRPHSRGHPHPSQTATAQFAQPSIPYPSQFATANDQKSDSHFVTDSHYIKRPRPESQFNPHNLYAQSQRSAQSSDTQLQLPTPPDESPAYFPAQRELAWHGSREELLRGKQELEWQREEDIGRYEREESAALVHGLPTPESTPSPPQMGRLRKISAPSPILADYMSVDPHTRERERDDWGGDTRASHGHESSLHHRLSVRGESSWSDMGEMGHEYRPPLPEPRREPSFGTENNQNARPDSTYVPPHKQASSRPKHAPKSLVMPTPLQQHQGKQVEDVYDEAWNAASSLLLSVHTSPTPNTSSHHLPQKPQNRNVLRKRSSAIVAPPPLPTVTVMGNLPPQAKMMGIKESKEGKVERAPRRLSKRRTDL